MNSAQPLGTLGSVASMLAATLYQGHHDRHRKLEYLIKGDIYISFASAAGMLLHINGKLTLGRLKYCPLS